MMQMQKVIQVGNSLAVTLDKSFVQGAGIRSGQQLAVVYKPEKGLMSVAKTKVNLSADVLTPNEQEVFIKSKITPELEQWTNKFLLENQEAMRKLADL